MHDPLRREPDTILTDPAIISLCSSLLPPRDPASPDAVQTDGLEFGHPGDAHGLSGELVCEMRIVGLTG